MELNWSTFVLEIFNFLILVWILKHFLYRPVLNVIARRQAGIEQTLAEAEQTRKGAQALQAQYENRLAVWDREKASAREILQQELASERERQLAALQSELAVEREKSAVREERRLAEIIEQNERLAMAQSGEFAARLLERLADPHLEARFTDVLLDELQQMPQQRVGVIRATVDANEPVEVVSAYTLDNPHRERIEQAMAQLLGRPVEMRFSEDTALHAGLCISAGPWVLQANLRDELKGFVEFAHEPA